MSVALQSVDELIDHWKPSGGNEMANFPIFAAEQLTQLIGVVPPNPAASDRQINDNRFERIVTFTHTSKPINGRIDLNRKSCLILETKQGSDKGNAISKDLLSY
ncbi:hypothetical protein [Polycladidibacter stylochi]|uniref:hypothetical protein n=1 Tax=Polycladidibacter stylochi TaxID=1807766 RepID=UPI000835A990|nr:hypothetical protein [Pseudovibrio stylochi]